MNKVRLPGHDLETFSELLKNMQAQGLAYTAELRGDYWEIEITGC